MSYSKIRSLMLVQVLLGLWYVITKDMGKVYNNGITFYYIMGSVFV